jgi:hypothetical protein
MFWLLTSKLLDVLEDYQHVRERGRNLVKNGVVNVLATAIRLVAAKAVTAKHSAYLYGPCIVQVFAIESLALSLYAFLHLVFMLWVVLLPVVPLQLTLPVNVVRGHHHVGEPELDSVVNRDRYWPRITDSLNPCDAHWGQIVMFYRCQEFRLRK